MFFHVFQQTTLVNNKNPASVATANRCFRMVLIHPNKNWRFGTSKVMISKCGKNFLFKTALLSLPGGWTTHLKNLRKSIWIISPKTGVKIKVLETTSWYRCSFPTLLKNRLPSHPWRAPWKYSLWSSSHVRKGIPSSQGHRFHVVTFPGCNHLQVMEWSSNC